MNDFFTMLGYDFVQRALIAGLLITVCAALLGVILVLKNYAMMGHGLSDVGFLSLTLGISLGWSPVYVSIPIVVAASFLIMFLSQRKNIRGDVIIGMIATASLALGMILLSVNSGFSTNVRNYMFGSILALQDSDVWMSVVLAAAVVTLFCLFFNKIFAVTYDPAFSAAMGVKTGWYQFLIAALTAFTVVISMRLIGTLLISSLIIFPAMTGKTIAKGFKGMIICAAAAGVVSFVLGMVFAICIDNVPAGAAIVLVNVALFAVASAVKFLARRRVSV